MATHRAAWKRRLAYYLVKNMVNISLLPYQPGLLPAILQIWNAGEFGQKFPLTAGLWQQQVERDPNFRPDDFVGAFDDVGNLRGFVLIKQFRELTANPDMTAYGQLGWIAVLLVAEDWRGQGLGSQLLALAEARLCAAKLPKIVLGGNFRHFWPGVPADLPRTLDFFQKHGYNLAVDRSDAFDLRCGLTDYQPLPPPPAVANGEFYFTQGQRGQEAVILEFLAQSFPGRWRYSLTLDFAQGGDPGDVTLLKRRATVGSQPDKIEGFLQTGHQKSRIIVNSLFWYPLLGQNYGGIGPLGVSKTVRGHQLGLALVDVGVNYLIHRGVTECAIDWTDLLDFYGRLGFGVWKSFKRLSKTLQSSAMVEAARPRACKKDCSTRTSGRGDAPLTSFI